MVPSRAFHTKQLASLHRDHPLGFRFAGHDQFFSDDYAKDERAIIEEQLTKADVFIDVGANQGFFAVWAASMGKIVAAVEPEPGNLNFLRSNIAANNLKVEVQPVAAAAHVGTLILFGDDATASLLPDWTGTAKGRQDVTCADLDHLFADRWPGKRIFIKISVSGFESVVLKGATKLIHQNPRPTWLIETLPRKLNERRRKNHAYWKVFETMEGAGYTITKATRAHHYLFVAR